MFETLIDAMKIKLEALPDNRKPSNATTYRVVDAVLSLITAACPPGCASRQLVRNHATEGGNRKSPFHIGLHHQLGDF